MSNTATNVESYIDYFRQLAVKHKDLVHDIASESGNGSPGSCSFSRWNATDLIKGMRTSVAPTCLLLELYEENYKAEHAFNVQGNLMGAFSVVSEAKTNDPQDEERAYAVTETIMAQLLNKIWHDHYGKGKTLCASPFKFFELAGAERVPIGPVLTNAYGWRFQFSFTLSNNYNITQDLPQGIFL
jgi:hypothetical protein